MTATRQQTVSLPVTTYMTAPSGLLQRKCACGGSSGLTGSCSGCEKNKLAGPSLQTKLRINEPGDAYEQEADRVAAQVMGMRGKDRSLSSHATAPLAQRKVGVNNQGAGMAPSIVNDVLSSPGQPLDAATREFFEPRFGHDFGSVRVHAGSRASGSANAVNALAYTSGADIVFGLGQYRPGTSAGNSLLAHELAHVVQQSAAPTQSLSSNPAQQRPATGSSSSPAPIIQRRLRVDPPAAQVNVPMDSPYIIFQDALARICDRIVIYSGDDLIMEKWPGQQPRTIERFVRRAMDAQRLYRLRLGARDLGGHPVRGAAWEMQGSDVVLTLNPAHVGQFTWTVDELLAEQLVATVNANDPEEIPSSSRYAGTVEALMSIRSVDDMLLARLPYGSTDTTKPEEINKLQIKTFSEVQKFVNENKQLHHLKPRQMNELLVSVRQAEGVTLLEIVQGVEANQRYRIVQTRQGNRVEVTYKDPNLTTKASAAETLVTAHKATFVPGADRTAGPAPLPLTGSQCSGAQNRSEDNSCCTNAMLGEITAHLQTARAHTERAIERLTSGADVDCYLKRNFGAQGTGVRKREITTQLRIALSELYISRHAWKCRPKGSGFLGCDKRDRGTVGGQVKLKDVSVLLCVNPNPDYSDWVSVLHEVVHRTGRFGAESYKGESGYPGKNPISNADSYARLAEELGSSNWKPCKD